MAILTREREIEQDTRHSLPHRYLFDDEYYEARRMVTNHIASLCYNLYTTILYFNSIDEFPQHAQGPGGKHLLNERISKVNASEHPWAIGALTVLGFFCTGLFYSNQRTFPKRLQKLRDHQNDIPATHAQYRLIDASISSVFKAITTSSSLYALLSNVSSAGAGPEAGFYIAIFGTGSCFLGNFFAQFSVFLEHFFDKLNLLPNHPQTRKGLSYYFAISYAISNAALYFNAFDAAPSHIGWSDHRLTEPQAVRDYFALIFGILMSLSFAYTTSIRFQERIYNLISKNSYQPLANNPGYGAINGAHDEDIFAIQDVRFSHKFNCSLNSAAAVWKTIVTTGSILGFISYNTDVMKNPSSETWLYCILLITTSFSFMPQLSLYARSNETIVKDELKARTKKPNEAGFFSKAKEYLLPSSCCQPTAELQA